jgi:DNA-binding PadR family transcriptional regulator
MQENNNNQENNGHPKSDRHQVYQDENNHRHAHHHEHEGEPGQPNFWRDWRSERHHRGQSLEIPTGQARSAKEIEEWREFFHKSFGNWPEEHWIFGGRRFSPWHQGMDSFNPFVANLLSKGGGLLPLYVLHLVAQKPRYGNEIMDLLAERTNGQWVSNPGAIYPLLTQLEREGFIKGEWEDPDKRTIRVYTISPAGQEELSRIKTIVSPKLEETVKVLQELLQDLLSPAAVSGQEPTQALQAETHTDKGIL